MRFNLFTHSAEDSVYMDSSVQRNEYVLEDFGMIWKGVSGQFEGIPWTFGQVQVAFELQTIQSISQFSDIVKWDNHVSAHSAREQKWTLSRHPRALDQSSSQTTKKRYWISRNRLQILSWCFNSLWENRYSVTEENLFVQNSVQSLYSDQCPYPAPNVWARPEMERLKAWVWLSLWLNHRCTNL